MRKKYIISLVCFNNLEYTKKCISSIVKHNVDDNVFLVVVNNASSDGTKKYLNKLQKEFNWIKIYHNTDNLGFGIPHNETFEKYKNKGDYFVVLNNDLEVCENWLDEMSSVISEKIAIVGIQGNCCSFGPGGVGTIGNKLEYIEGSCLMIKTELAKKHGLFSDEFEFAYCEDADMSLRYRELGYDIAAVRLNIYHVREVTSKEIKKKKEIDLKGYAIKNHYKLLTKWRTYFLKRNFNYNILVIRNQAKGDVLLTTPIIAALKRKYPLSQIIVQTGCPDIFKENKFITSIVPASVPIDLNRGVFDVVFNLDNSYERKPYTHLVDAYAETCKLTEDEYDKSELILYTEPPYFSLPRKYVVLHPGHTAWVGRNWTPNRWGEIAKRLKKEDYRVLLVGDRNSPQINLYSDNILDLRGKTSIHSLAHIMKNAKFFIGIDSMPFHVAQSQNTPGVVFFGCILPELRIVRDNMTAVNAIELNCIGCHHWQTAPRNCCPSCLRKEQDCVSNVTVDRMWKEIKKLC